MENASKALLIVGAILIAILIIGIGMMVMQGGEGPVHEAILKMSAQEKDIFNNDFTRYAGEKVTGTNVRALLQNVISSNNANKDIAGKLVSVKGDLGAITPTEGDAKSNEISNARTKVNTGKIYTVIVEYNEKTGLVEAVNITESKK